MIKLLFGQPPVNVRNAKLKYINLSDVYKLITTDKKLKEATDKISTIEDKTERKQLKSTILPYILPFEYSELIRNSKNFVSAELLIYEADNLEEYDSIFKVVKEDKNILLAYKSVSGNGIKFIVQLSQKINADYYLRIYNVYKSYFQNKFNLQLDPANKDMARVQYLAFDKHAYYNEKAKPIDVSETMMHLDLFDKSPVNKLSDDELDYDIDDIAKAIKYIRSHGYLEVKDEQLWWELSMSLASLGEEGREYFLLLSEDNPQYPSDTRASLNKRYDSLIKAWGNYHDEDRVLNMNSFFNIIEKRFNYKITRLQKPGKKSLEFILADKFTQKYKNLILFDHSKAGKNKSYGWFIWDGRYFMQGKKGEISDYYLKFISDEKKIAIEEAKRAKELKEQDTVGEELGLLNYESDTSMSLAMIARAESRRLRDLTLTWSSEREGLGVLPDELDENVDLFNCLNGTINLRTRKLLKHSPEFRMTKLAPVLYQPGAKCPNWEEFILKISFNNIEIAKYIQEAVGYTLTGHTSEQCLFFLYGIGANGKSTFLEGLKLIFGDYQIHSNYETFTNINRDGSNHSEDVVRLKGSRLVISSEINMNKALNESIIKQITSGDTVTARDLHASSIEFKPTFKLWIAGNHKPKIQNFDHGIKRRIFIIPFEYIFGKAEIRPQSEILEEFKQERSGILNWTLEGAKRWYKNKSLTVPQIITDTTNKYFLENNIIEQWIYEKCIIYSADNKDTHKLYESVKDLYQAYIEYVEFSNEEKLGRNQFYSRMEELGFKRDVNQNRVAIFRGIKLKESIQEEPAKVKKDLPI